jgi:hypothetical protein
VGGTRTFGIINALALGNKRRTDAIIAQKQEEEHKIVLLLEQIVFIMLSDRTCTRLAVRVIIIIGSGGLPTQGIGIERLKVGFQVST